ncbi:MAG: response regulator [Gemmataceae bacterium]|nr:response regulator [Gemmata sp.]MDW8199205.1 response regulator [Gemmataceae bacterium]
MTTSSPLKILIVEDELIIAADIAARLHRLGYTVVGQTDQAQEAVRLVGELHPDLVLMDIRLHGEGDGITAADTIRRQYFVPVVYLTAHADEATLQRAKVTEPFGYVLKPFAERELRTVIEMALYRHAAERRLQESERRFATTLRSIGDAVVATDAAGRVTFLNPVAEQLTGWKLDDAKGKPLSEIFRIVNEETRKPVENPVEKVLATGRIVGLANSTVLISRDGREYPIDDCAAPIHDDAGQVTGVVLVFRDVTEERRREAELLQAQKMEAIGRLAGGIAHDFNNLLTVISGYTVLLREGLGADSPWRDALEQIETASRRGADLTRQLLAYCRKQIIQPRLCSFNQLVNDSLKMLRRVLPATIELITEFTTADTTIRADPTQIDQVIVNLVLNARDAMPDGGRLRLATYRGQAWPGQDPFPAGGPYVAVEVTDTGIGMDTATLARIWEPFFTTKQLGHGTGLGLSTVYGIVKQSGGHIVVKSRPGEGSTFTVTLPAVTEAIATSPTQGVTSSFPQGQETILLVDDDDAVRSLSAMVLRSCGYKILEASSGIEAAEMVAHYDDTIHLLLTDLVMPQMSGRTLADIVRSQITGIKVLFMTGYSEVPLTQSPGGESVWCLLKPFTPQQLAERVREVLDQVNPSSPARG